MRKAGNTWDYRSELAGKGKFALLSLAKRMAGNTWDYRFEPAGTGRFASLFLAKGRAGNTLAYQSEVAGEGRLALLFLAEGGTGNTLDYRSELAGKERLASFFLAKGRREREQRELERERAGASGRENRKSNHPNLRGWGKTSQFSKTQRSNLLALQNQAPGEPFSRTRRYHNLLHILQACDSRINHTCFAIL